jgi:hypothetical protein
MLTGDSTWNQSPIMFLIGAEGLTNCPVYPEFSAGVHLSNYVTFFFLLKFHLFFLIEIPFFLEHTNQI